MDPANAAGAGSRREAGGPPGNSEAEIAALYRSAAAVSASLDLERVLDAIVGQVMKLVGPDACACAIFRLDESKNSLRIVSARGLPQAYVNQARVPVGELAVGAAVAKGHPVTTTASSGGTLDLPPPRHAGSHDRPGAFKTVLGIPLLAKGRPLGAIAVYSCEEREFPPAEVSMLSIFASYAAIAIENAALYAQVQRRLAESLSIQEVGAALVRELDLGNILRLVAGHARRLAEASGSLVALPAPGGTRLEIRVVRGERLEPLLGQQVPVDGSLLGVAFRSGRAVRSDDVMRDPRLRHRRLAGRARIKSLVAVPLRIKDQVLGVLAVVNPGPGFDAAEVEVLQLLGHHAAIALENAGLHEKARELAVAEERSRLARELHDSISQSLFSLVLNAEALAELTRRDPARAQALAHRVKEISQEALVEMRSLIFELRPAALEEKGLVTAIRNHVELFRRRQGIDVEFEASGGEVLAKDVQLALYRVAQEALSNVAKHARATRVRVSLQVDEVAARLVVADDGVGFDPAFALNPGLADRQAHLGLTSMRERAELVGGRLQLDSGPGRGTRVVVTVPVADTASRDAG